MSAAPVFQRRVGALLADAALVAAVVLGIVYGSAAMAPPGYAPFAPFWAPPAPVRVVSEAVGEPSAVKLDGGVERTLAYRREMRILRDGTIRLYGIVDSRLISGDGTETLGRTELLVGEPLAAVRQRWATIALCLLLPLGYFGFFEASRLQATPGKLLFGLAVTDGEGRRLTPARAAMRQCLKLLDLASSMVTFFIAAFTRRGQALHDILAGTLVVRRRSC
jgi:uncharacterized RDD family membrane protein YckC